MKLATTPEWLKADASGNPVGVDRKNEIIHGVIIAQEGQFKSEGRGEFDKAALKQIVKLTRAAPNGLKSRFAHPSLSGDGVGKFLGRIKNPRMDVISVRESEGELKTDEINIVRADLHLSKTAFQDNPNGNLGKYVMDLADDDADAFSTSLVLTTDKTLRMDKFGRPLRDEDGNELPPLWFPRRLHASDVVDTGDAVDGMLSTDGLPDAIVRQGTTLLDEQFAGQTREVVESRCVTWLQRYLDNRYGEPEDEGDPLLPLISESYDPARDAALRLRRFRAKQLARIAQRGKS